MKYSEGKINGIDAKTAVLLPVLVLLSFVYYFFYEYNSLIYDDAFITYRYALNFAAGRGFVYNAGEHVYGTTTLLYAFYLGLVSFISGAGNLHVFSQISSLIFYNAAFIFIFFKYRINVFLLPVIYILLFFNEYVYYSVFSGMETAFVYFLLLISIVYREKKIIFILIPLLMLARIDAAFIFAFAYILYGLYGVLKKQKPVREFIQNLLLLAAGVLAAFAITWLLFGTIVPNTLLAKNVIYKDSVFDQSFLYRLNQMRSFGYPSVISVPVVIFLIYIFFNRLKKKPFGERTITFTALFSLLYFLFEIITVTRINLWYITLLSFPVILLLALILNEYPDRMKYSVLALAAASVFNLYSNHKFGSVIFADHRNNLLKSELYQVAEKINPGSKVFCGDIGVIGYYCPDSYIYDYSGLVTPAAIEHNKVKKDYGEKGITTDYNEILKQISEINPDYANFRDYPFYFYVKSDSSFNARYRIIFPGREENLYSRK